MKRLSYNTSCAAVGAIVIGALIAVWQGGEIKAAASSSLEPERVAVTYVTSINKSQPVAEAAEQFNEMRAWCISNRTKRKTRRGITKFVNSWLSREQDKGNRRYGGQGQSPMEQWADNVRGWASNDNR